MTMNASPTDQLNRQLSQQLNQRQHRRIIAAVLGRARVDEQETGCQIAEVQAAAGKLASSKHEQNMVQEPAQEATPATRTEGDDILPVFKDWLEGQDDTANPGNKLGESGAARVLTDLQNEASLARLQGRDTATQHRAQGSAAQHTALRHEEPEVLSEALTFTFGRSHKQTKRVVGIGLLLLGFAAISVYFNGVPSLPPESEFNYSGTPGIVKETPKEALIAVPPAVESLGQISPPAEISEARGTQTDGARIDASSAVSNAPAEQALPDSTQESVRPKATKHPKNLTRGSRSAPAPSKSVANDSEVVLAAASSVAGLQKTATQAIAPIAIAGPPLALNSSREISSGISSARIHKQLSLTLAEIVLHEEGGAAIAWFSNEEGRVGFKEGDRLPGGELIKKIDTAKGSVTVSDSGVSTIFFIGK